VRGMQYRILANDSEEDRERVLELEKKSVIFFKASKNQQSINIKPTTSHVRLVDSICLSVYLSVSQKRCFLFLGPRSTNNQKDKKDETG
jgi:hypothetical protein